MENKFILYPHGIAHWSRRALKCLVNSNVLSLNYVRIRLGTNLMKRVEGSPFRPIFTCTLLQVPLQWVNPTKFSALPKNK